MLSLVVPVYFEEECIIEFVKQTTCVMDSNNIDYEIIFIDDGSVDRTVELIKNNAEENQRIKLIEFSYNHGKQSAVTAGVNHAIGDYILYMDPDLQDPPEMIPVFLNKIIEEDLDIIFGIRSEKNDTWLNKKFSALFWKVLQSLTKLNLPANLAVMRIFSRRFADEFSKFSEQNRFIEGIFMKIGLNMSTLIIENKERFAGKTKFNFKKKVELALNAIYDFSDIPLKLAVRIGLFFVITGFISILVVLTLKILYVNFQAGWPSLLAITTLYFGILILLVGIVAIYLGRVYKEVKGRPLYSIKRKTNLE